MTSGWSSVRSRLCRRDAAQVEHGQDVGVAHLVLQAEADQVEVAERGEGFQAVQRPVLAAQQGFKVDPGSEGPFAGPLGIVIHDRVQHLQTMVAHAQGVGVGEGQAQGAADPAVVLDDAVQLAADVLSGRLHAGQQARDAVLQGRVEHVGFLSAKGSGPKGNRAL